MANSNSTQHNGWGGNWTEQKLVAFEKYVRAYLTIMNMYREKYNWKLLYFDGFAGCGGRTQQERNEEANTFVDLFGEDCVNPTELQVYEGAAERVVKVERDMRGFDFYYFIDKYEENCARLEMKLAEYPTVGYKVFRPGDANVVALQMADALRKDTHLKSLCFLDPFGMNLGWNTIQQIAGKSMDLWILVPTGVIVNRLLKKNGDLLHSERLVDFFGMSEAEIKAKFYQKTIMTDLFGQERVEVIKAKNTIGKIAELYCERLGELFPYVTNKPLVLYNSNNVPIYHLVCASYNQTAVKIAQDIIKKMM